MLKGVNKSVIEVSCPESGYFERAILFVRPEQSCMSSKRLQNEARRYIDLLDCPSLPPRAGEADPKRKRLILLGIFTATLGVAVAVLLTVFNIL